MTGLVQPGTLGQLLGQEQEHHHEQGHCKTKINYFLYCVTSRFQVLLLDIRQGQKLTLQYVRIRIPVELGTGVILIFDTIYVTLLYFTVF